LHIPSRLAWGERLEVFTGNFVTDVLEPGESTDIQFDIPAAEPPGGLISRDLLDMGKDSTVVQLELHREDRGIYLSSIMLPIVPVAPFRTVLLGGFLGVVLANLIIVLAIRLRQLPKTAPRDFVPEILFGMLIMLVIAISAYTGPPAFALDLSKGFIANDLVDGFWLGLAYNIFAGGVLALVRRKSTNPES
jgi:hypothetical protein